MKKVLKKPAKKGVVKKAAKRTLLGRVTHYYDHIKVAVIILSASLKKGDVVEIEGGGTSFKQQVVSMEKDHKRILRAKKGDEIGMRVKKKTREGYRVYKG